MAGKKETQKPLMYDDVRLILTRTGGIRLLKLGMHDEKLHVQLRVANLDDKPVYKALSYTWGPATRVKAQRFGALSENEQRPNPVIVCNDRSLEVTQNLYDCLLQLNKTFPSNPESHPEFWIDAICINQATNGPDDERCQQVSIMSKIYHQAEEVVIWLGVSDESTPLARNIIEKIGSIWPDERRHPNKPSVDGLLPNKTNETLIGLLKIPPITKTNIAAQSYLGEVHSQAHWRSILDFFSRSWFTRSWVVQEFVLARKTIVLCGETTLDWDHITATSDFLSRRVSRNKLRSWVGDEFDIRTAAYKTPAKLEAVKRDILEKHPSVLTRSLIRCRDRECEKEKDKIFSILGIYQVVTETQLCKGDMLYPDYCMDTAQVYTNAARQILELETDLTLLTVAEGEDFRCPQKSKNLPSWAPDWRFSTQDTSIGLGITGYTRFDACAAGDRQLGREIAFSDDNAVLFLKAARLDKIIRTGETKEQVENGEGFDGWLSILESYESTSRYRDKDSQLDAFWRTLITNTNEDGDCPAPPSLQAGFLHWIMRKCANLDDGVRKRAMRILALNEARLQSKLPRDARDNLVAKFEVQYAHAFHQRPFLTSEGHLGLGSRSLKLELCEKGECEYSVWIVYGSRVPLIFRDTARSGRYSLVGGAYVHGFMKGEALQRDLRFDTIGLE